MINKFSIYNGSKYFSSGMFQNYLAEIPAKNYIKYFSGTTSIDSWKSNGISEENIENIPKSDSKFVPTFVDHNGHCLINNISILITRKVINLYISYALGPQLRSINTDFTLGNCLLISAKVTKNGDLDK